MRYTSRGQIKVHDQQLVNQLSQNVFSASQRNKSFIWTFIFSILFFFIGVGAYISRSFLRINIGERTIGGFTILLSYPFLWLVYAYHTVWLSIPASEYAIEENLNIYEKIYSYYLIASFDNIEEFFTAISFGKFQELGIGFLPLNLEILWYLVIVLSITHIARIIRLNRKNGKLHSFYRGDSFFFKSLGGMKISGTEVSPPFIWIVIEPLFIVFLSYVIQIGLDLDTMAVTLRISAICLFLEEYRVYSQNRNMILDIIDSNIDAEYVVSVQTERTVSSTSNLNKEGVGRAVIY